MPTSDQAATWLLVRKCNPFDKRDSLVTHMHDLYPLSFHVLVVARFEEYSIPFPSYLGKGFYLCVVEDRIYIRNYDFNEMAELVWLEFFYHVFCVVIFS